MERWQDEIKTRDKANLDEKMEIDAKIQKINMNLIEKFKKIRIE